jgi:hypothetical protein
MSNREGAGGGPPIEASVERPALESRMNPARFGGRRGRMTGSGFIETRPLGVVTSELIHSRLIAFRPITGSTARLTC